MSLLILFDRAPAAPPPPKGVGLWGISPWGSVVDVITTTVPRIIYRSPLARDRNVNENAVLQIVFFDSDADIVASTMNISIDGATIYNGSDFATGYVGSLVEVGGRAIVEIVKNGGWGYDTTVQVSAYVADALGNSVSETWDWNTRPDPVCYAGLTPLEIEQLLLTPLTQFLDLDVVRKTLLDNALHTQSVTNASYRATRVIYQLGFDTEISTVLNPWNLRDETALAVTVCERQSSVNIDRALVGVQARLLAGISALRLNGALPEEYRTAFQGYLDSVQYAYRVSLAANLVMLAHAVEAYGPRH